jgi:hypothetical protein
VIAVIQSTKIDSCMDVKSENGDRSENMLKKVKAVAVTTIYNLDYNCNNT